MCILIRYGGGNSATAEEVHHIPASLPYPSWLVEEGHPANKTFAPTFQNEAHEKEYYIGSDVARVNKVRASAYGPGRQWKVGYGPGVECEGRPCAFEDWFGKCVINEEEGG